MRSLLAALTFAGVLLVGTGPVLAQEEEGPEVIEQHVPEAGVHGHINWWNVRPKPGQGQPFIAMVFNFLVLGLLLGRFALPPIREYVKDRHETIKTDIAEAQRLRAEALARLEEYERKLADIDRAIAELLQGIRSEAEAEGQRVVAAAEEQAARLRREAEFTIAQDMKRLRREIEREVVDAALAAAEKLVAAQVNETDQRAFVERYLAGIKGGRSSELPGGGA